MVVEWGVRQADRDGLQGSSASTSDATERVQGILHRAGYVLVGSEGVIPVENLEVFGMVRKPIIPPCDEEWVREIAEAT